LSGIEPSTIGNVSNSNSNSNSNNNNNNNSDSIHNDMIQSQSPLKSNTNAIANNSKVKIKRPLLLAAKKKKTVYHRNKFAEIAPYMYYPLLKTLMNYIQTFQNKSGSAWKMVDVHSDTATLASINIMPSSNVGSSNNSSGDSTTSIDLMLPSRLLHALGIFTKCSVNTTLQQDFIVNTLKVSILLKDLKAIDIRRSVLFAVLCSFESLEALKNNRAGRPVLDEHKGGVLGSLMSITSNPDTSSSGMDGSGDAFMIETVIAIVDWVIKSLKQEAEVVCRAFLAEIGQVGLSIIQSYQGNQ
jgi:hypothetical protein